MNEFCISQGSADDIFTCKGQGGRFSQNLVGFPRHPSSLHTFCSPFLSYPFQLSPPKSNWGVWIALWAVRGRASAADQLNNYFRLEILNGDNFHSVTNFSPWQLGWVQCGLLMGWTQDTSKVVGSGPQDAGGNRRLWLRGNISQSRSQFFLFWSSSAPVVENDVWSPDECGRNSDTRYSIVLTGVPCQLVVTPFLRTSVRRHQHHQQWLPWVSKKTRHEIRSKLPQILITFRKSFAVAFPAKLYVTTSIIIINL